MMGKLTVWVQSQEEEEEQYIHSPDESVSQSQHVVEVGRRRGEERGRIQEEEDRGWRAIQMEKWRIKEAEEERKAGNSRYEKRASMATSLV